MRRGEQLGLYTAAGRTSPDPPSCMSAAGMGADGERVIQGSRRPDGTYRKDVKVMAGYVPQDEQPVYVPRGAVVRLSMFL